MVKHVRIRKSKRGEYLLAVPRALVDQLSADYVGVAMDGAGRLIYTPIKETV